MTSEVRFVVDNVSRWGSCGGGRVWIVFEGLLEVDRMGEGVIL